MADTDTAILSGSDSAAESALPTSAQSWMAGANNGPVVPPPDASILSGAAPDISGNPDLGTAPGTPILAGGPSVGPAPVAPPTPAGQRSVWKDLVAGALYGLAGSAGAKHFGEGLGRGVGGVIQAKQTEIENAQKQKQFEFESLRSADSHIEALARAKQADTASEESKVSIIEHQQQVNEYAIEHGQKPVFTISADNPADMHAQAVGGLSTLAQRNGGTVPAVTTVDSPATSNDPNHKIDVYAPTEQDVKNNPNGTNKTINDARAAQGLPPLSDSDIMVMGGQKSKGNAYAGVKQMLQEAQNFLYNPPSVSSNSAENAATSASLQQQIDSYSKKPDADQQVLKLMQTRKQAFDAMAYDQQGKSNAAKAAEITATAPAEAQAARTKKLAELDTPQGRAELAKTQQETINAQYKNAEDHQKSLFNEGVDPITHERLNLSNAPDEALIDERTKQPIPTKMLSQLAPTMQEKNRADFASSVLHSLDQIDQLRAAGKLPNGPLSGLTAKALSKAGLGSADAQKAIDFISFAQSAATGAHVGGRFSLPVMEKMNQMIGMNMNDGQFTGAEEAIRSVMTQYTQTGGRQTVAEYKQSMIGSTVTLKSGQKVTVTGFDKNGQMVGQPVK